jgi:hypothetical protein
MENYKIHFVSYSVTVELIRRATSFMIKCRYYQDHAVEVSFFTNFVIFRGAVYENCQDSRIGNEPWL